MADRGRRRLFISGCLFLFLDLHILMASPLTSLGIRSQADCGAAAAYSSSLGLSCSKGLCRECHPRPGRTTRSLPLLFLSRGSVLPALLDASTEHDDNGTGPHFQFRPAVKQRSVTQTGDHLASKRSSSSDSGDPLISESRSHSEQNRKGDKAHVEDDAAGIPEDLKQQQFTKRSAAFRKKYPRRRSSPTIKLWPRVTSRNFKLGKTRQPFHVLPVKRRGGVDLPGKSSAPSSAVAPAASPHRWAVFFIGKRPI